MGSFWIYQAFPEHAPVLDEARNDPQMGTLFGLIAYEELSPLNSDRDFRRKQAVESVVAEELFPDAPSAQGALRRVVAAIDSVKQDTPGLEQRRSYLNKGESTLVEAVMRGVPLKNQNVNEEWISTLVYGGERLVPPSYHFDPLPRVVQAIDVKRAAEILSKMEPSVIYPPDSTSSPGGPRDFERWRDLYVKAAQHDELVLVFLT